MIIKIRHCINFDVVVEHRSTTTLSWIYYAWHRQPFVGNIYDLHNWGLSVQIEDTAHSYIIKRDPVERFLDGFTAFTTRILKYNVDINQFVDNIKEWSNHDKFDIYLEPIVYSPTHKIIEYNDKKMLQESIENAYKINIPDELLDMYTQRKPVTEQVLSNDSIEKVRYFYTSNV